MSFLSLCVCCFPSSLRRAYSWLSFLTLVKKSGENFWLWQTSPLLIRLILTTVKSFNISLDMLARHSVLFFLIRKNSLRICVAVWQGTERLHDAWQQRILEFPSVRFERSYFPPQNIYSLLSIKLRNFRINLVLAEFCFKLIQATCGPEALKGRGPEPNAGKGLFAPEADIKHFCMLKSVPLEGHFGEDISHRGWIECPHILIEVGDGCIAETIASHFFQVAAGIFTYL